MSWYKMEAASVVSKLDSAPEGLSDQEAQRRLKQYGPNILPESGGINYLKIALEQFANPLIYILLAASAITISLGEYKDSIAILVVVFLNAAIGFYQEVKAERSVRALKTLLVPVAQVLRGGKELPVSSRELVPGDIVLLTSGNRVPADLRLMQTVELKIDESMLTGESLPAEKNTATIAEDNLTPGDQRNIAFMGTIVVNGRAKGIVVETGVRTILGGIAGDIQGMATTRAPLQEKFEKFAKLIGAATVVICAVMFAAGILRGEPAGQLFLLVVAAIVAAVPEGLPIVVTVAMSIGVARMAKRNAIVRKLPSVETLGSTTVICSDKTGTLTKNEMTVKALFDGRNAYEVQGVGYAPSGGILCEYGECSPEHKAALEPLLKAGLLCNESSLYQEGGQWKVQGDPTEAALIVCAQKGGLDYQETMRQNPRIAIIPFESDRGWMATLNNCGGKNTVFVKGGFERILEMCVPGDYSASELRAVALAKEGMRVLACAYKELPAGKTTLDAGDASGLVFAGLTAMIDPPREEAVAAIAQCRKAGIRVIMITGDHAITAAAISEQLGIADRGAAAISGRELDTISDEDLFEKLQTVSVFARVSPQHKLRIVSQLMKAGHIVAVTGDGVNDAPALKAAHIGVAMGKTGTDVAKETADMVAADDNFASIFSAVVEGRVVYDNIRKATFFLIPTGLAAILSLIGAMFMGLPAPYLPIQLLWINLVTNGLQDVALAFEPAEPGVMDRQPRNPKEHIMTRVMVERTFIVGVLIAAGILFIFQRAIAAGYSIEHSRTLAVTTMVMFQFFQAWNSRSERLSIFRMNPLGNPFLAYSMLAATLAQLMVIYEPFMGRIFSTSPLTEADWLMVLPVAASVLAVIEADKYLRGRKNRAQA